MNNPDYPFACYPVEAIVAAIEFAKFLSGDDEGMNAGIGKFVGDYGEPGPDDDPMPRGTGWPIYISAIPEKNDPNTGEPNTVNNILVCSTQGKSDNPKWLVDYPGITIMVAADPSLYDEAYKKAKAIDEVLLGIRGIKYGKDSASCITSITQFTPLIDLGRDRIEEDQRCRFTLNYSLIVEPAPSPLSSRLPL